MLAHCTVFSELQSVQMWNRLSDTRAGPEIIKLLNKHSLFLRLVLTYESTWRQQLTLKWQYDNDLEPAHFDRFYVQFAYRVLS